MGAGVPMAGAAALSLSEQIAEVIGNASDSRPFWSMPFSIAHRTLHHTRLALATDSRRMKSPRIGSSFGWKPMCAGASLLRDSPDPGRIIE